VARVFGPISLVWFLALAILGVGGIAAAPEVLAALNPAHGVAFFAHNGPEGFFVLGAVFLVVTGAEALYADLGHFGAAPIRLAWAVVVMPALLLNDLGQGALLLRHGPEIQHPFFALVPPPLLYPVIALATVATIIASQAVISGCFSLTNQAIQLGYCPRLAVRHTSPAEFGQPGDDGAEKKHRLAPFRRQPNHPRLAAQPCDQPVVFMELRNTSISRRQGGESHDAASRAIKSRMEPTERRSPGSMPRSLKSTPWTCSK
jgi:hypothetical protein